MARVWLEVKVVSSFNGGGGVRGEGEFSFTGYVGVKGQESFSFNGRSGIIGEGVLPLRAMELD